MMRAISIPASVKIIFPPFQYIYTSGILLCNTSHTWNRQQYQEIEVVFQKIDLNLWL